MIIHHKIASKKRLKETFFVQSLFNNNNNNKKNASIPWSYDLSVFPPLNMYYFYISE